jgi:hypothetical protein
MSRQAARKRKLAEAGIVYDFGKVGYVSIVVIYVALDRYSQGNFVSEKVQRGILMTAYMHHVLPELLTPIIAYPQRSNVVTPHEKNYANGLLYTFK